MIFSVVVFYFVFGIVEMIIVYKKKLKKEVYIYAIFYVILIVFSNLIYFKIIPSNFYKILDYLIKPLK